MKILRGIYRIVAFLLGASVLYAAALYGLLKDAVAATPQAKYAADFLLDGQPIHYAVSDKVTTAEEEKLFVESIKKWPRETARMIEKRGRAEVAELLKSAGAQE